MNHVTLHTWYVRMCIYIYTNMYTYTYIYVCICVTWLMYTYTYISGVQCVYIYTNMYTYTYIYVYIYAFTCGRMKHIQICVHIHMKVYIYIHICIYISVYVYIFLTHAFIYSTRRIDIYVTWLTCDMTHLWHDSPDVWHKQRDKYPHDALIYMWHNAMTQWHVSLAEYSLFYRALLQKRAIILRSLLIIATPYVLVAYWTYKPVTSHLWTSHVTHMNDAIAVCDTMPWLI